MQDMIRRIYQPNDRKRRGALSAWRVMFSNMVEHRELIFQLFLRDFAGEYKKSLLGMSWFLVAPIIGILSWLLMNATGILRPGAIGVPYPAYVLLGSTLWGLFIGFNTAASNTLSSGVAFMLQVDFPHEILLVQTVAKYLAGFIVSLVANIIMLVFFGVVPHWPIFLLPILMIPIFFIGGGIGLLVSVLSVVSTDTRRIFDLLIGLTLYVTPVIYSSNVENAALRTVVKWNPLTYLIGGARDLILLGHMDSILGYAVSSVFALIIFLLSWRLFYISEHHVVERML